MSINLEPSYSSHEEDFREKLEDFTNMVDAEYDVLESIYADLVEQNKEK